MVFIIFYKLINPKLFYFGMDITVGVCAYNEEANIGKLLAQILTQRTKEFRIKEVIVVSSGSTDKTDEIVERFAQRYGKVVLMRQRKRAGKYSAINLILKHSQTPIIAVSYTHLRAHETKGF